MGMMVEVCWSDEWVSILSSARCAIDIGYYILCVLFLFLFDRLDILLFVDVGGT